jgi:hypothetical protein
MAEPSKATFSLEPTECVLPFEKSSLEIKRISLLQVQSSKTTTKEFLFFAHMDVSFFIVGINAFYGITPRMPDDPKKGKEHVNNGNLRAYSGNGKFFGTYTTGPCQLFFLGYNSKLLEVDHRFDDIPLEEQKKVMRSLSGGLAELPKQLIESATRIGHLRLNYKFPPKASWSKGRVVLVGDAAHAVMP